jgi:chemotaxis protein MotB
MARKRYEEDTENHERWLISYADFMTLLFAFFVVMYAISVVNVGKYKVLSDALGDAFGGRGAAVAPNTAVEQPFTLPNIVARKRLEAMRREKDRLTQLARDLTATLGPLVKEGKVRVTQNSRGVSVEINASVLFAPGDAALTDTSREALSAVAILLKNDPHQVQVEGHTDDVPISNPLTAVGHGANLPVAPNDTPDGRARNRRVAVTIISALPDVTTEVPAR